ncbi:PAAR domain-containing protein [Jeongeupia naejangsanensis]|uniref:PAAR domain-containing protein n=1 Tax=Jeongeupia naejangsanensis TaxID=613195 RepID=A0ABS2BK91_9NEIS|nr:PAAR domain-containing protein [Jeongeupia naejangsanensis]MBM3115249.1 PAAR domain-containing protein [Jeongeupia naejangsanensis]
MKKVIRLGDPTSHGGSVVSASPNAKAMGKAIARLGDSVSCPEKGHGSVTIVEGDPNWLIDGKPVALEGHKTSCGAALISTVPNVAKG